MGACHATEWKNLLRASHEILNLTLQININIFINTSILISFIHSSIQLVYCTRSILNIPSCFPSSGDDVEVEVAPFRLAFGRKDPEMFVASKAASGAVKRLGTSMRSCPLTTSTSSSCSTWLLLSPCCCCCCSEVVVVVMMLPLTLVWLSSSVGHDNTPLRQKQKQKQKKQKQNMRNKEGKEESKTKQRTEPSGAKKKNRTAKQR